MEQKQESLTVDERAELEALRETLKESPEICLSFDNLQEIADHYGRLRDKALLLAKSYPAQSKRVWKRFYSWEDVVNQYMPTAYKVVQSLLKHPLGGELSPLKPLLNRRKVFSPLHFHTIVSTLDRIGGTDYASEWNADDYSDVTGGEE